MQKLKPRTSPWDDARSFPPTGTAMKRSLPRYLEGRGFSREHPLQVCAENFSRPDNLWGVVHLVMTCHEEKLLYFPSEKPRKLPEGNSSHPRVSLLVFLVLFLNPFLD